MMYYFKSHFHVGHQLSWIGNIGGHAIDSMMESLCIVVDILQLLK